MKYTLNITPFGTIGDIQNRQDLELVNIDSDVEFIKEYLGGTDKRTKYRKQLTDYSLFFVKIDNGEYTEVYGSTSSVAWLSARLDKIEVIRE